MIGEHLQYLREQQRSPYLLIDGALVEELRRLVYHLAGDSSPAFVPLLKDFLGGEDDEQLPLLLQAEVDSELFSYFADLLEHRPAGCIISSSASLETVAQHCNSLTLVTSENQTTNFLRFYDPRNLGGIVTVFEDALPKMLGPIERITWCHRGQWRHRDQQQTWDGNLQLPGWLQVSDQQVAALDRYKENESVERLVETYHQVITAQGGEPRGYVAEQVQSAKGQGFHQLSQLERWLRLALMQGASFWQAEGAQIILGNSEHTTEHKLAQLEQLLGAQG